MVEPLWEVPAILKIYLLLLWAYISLSVLRLQRCLLYKRMRHQCLFWAVRSGKEYEALVPHYGHYLAALDERQ